MPSPVATALALPRQVLAAALALPLLLGQHNSPGTAAVALQVASSGAKLPPPPRKVLVITSHKTGTFLADKLWQAAEPFLPPGTSVEVALVEPAFRTPRWGWDAGQSEVAVQEATEALAPEQMVNIFHSCADWDAAIRGVSHAGCRMDPMNETLLSEERQITRTPGALALGLGAAAADAPLRVVHHVRDPKSIVVSAYEYHLRVTKEEFWLALPMGHNWSEASWRNVTTGNPPRLPAATRLAIEATPACMKKKAQNGGTLCWADVLLCLNRFEGLCAEARAQLAMTVLPMALASRFVLAGQVTRRRAVELGLEDFLGPGSNFSAAAERSLSAAGLQEGNLSLALASVDRRAKLNEEGLQLNDSHVTRGSYNATLMTALLERCDGGRIARQLDQLREVICRYSSDGCA